MRVKSLRKRREVTRNSPLFYFCNSSVPQVVGFSGGMKKRVGLARAIAHEPEILLYDEPTTGLDPIMAAAINDLIVEMNKHLSVTDVAITQDMNSAYKIADRIAMLYEGKIVDVGTPDEIKNTANPLVRQFITGSASGPIKVEGVQL